MRGLKRLSGGRVEPGDIIVGVQSYVVRDFDDLYNAFDRFRPGDTVSVKIERGGKPLALTVTLVNIQ